MSGKETYIRRNGAVINTDNDGLKAYKLKKQQMRNTEARIEDLEGKLDRIVDDLEVIKELLMRDRRA